MKKNGLKRRVFEFKNFILPLFGILRQFSIGIGIGKDLLVFTIGLWDWYFDWYSVCIEHRIPITNPNPTNSKLCIIEYQSDLFKLFSQEVLL